VILGNGNIYCHGFFHASAPESAGGKWLERGAHSVDMDGKGRFFLPVTKIFSSVFARRQDSAGGLIGALREPARVTTRFLDER
jgi:hypothetical protein